MALAAVQRKMSHRSRYGLSATGHPSDSMSSRITPRPRGRTRRFQDPHPRKSELIAYRPWKSLAQCQREFDRWRTVYNFERPHEALKLEVPASRYRPSPRPFPGRLPAIEYGPDDHVCNVGWNGSFEYEGRSLQVSSALKGFPVAVRPTTTDGLIEIYFWQSACWSVPS